MDFIRFRSPHRNIRSQLRLDGFSDMTTLSDKLEKLLRSMGLPTQEWRSETEREGWELVFATRHPDIWYRRARREPKKPARIRAAEETDSHQRTKAATSKG